MLPPNSVKTYVSVSIAGGKVSEAPISNEKFLSSYLEYTCWLRMVQGKQLLATIENKDSTEIEMLAAVAAFYQNAGLMVEDALTMYIAWTLWSLDKSRPLPDIIERLNLRLSEPKQAPATGYLSSVQAKYLESEKKIDVHARAYLVEVMNRPDEDLLRAIGIDWKRNPSVKLVPPEQLEFWNNFAYYLRECLKPLVDRKGMLLATCYNKIKHGPQLIVMSPQEAADVRGISRGEPSTLESSPALRILCAGSRTQEIAGELESGQRVAPFLVADASNTRRWYFQQIVHTSNALYINGTWIFNSTYKERKRPLHLKQGTLSSIIVEQGRHNERVFGPGWRQTSRT